MVVYISTIALVSFFGCFAQMHNKMKRRGLRGEQDPINKYGIWYVFLFLTLFIVSGFRYQVGTDFGYYYTMPVDSWSQVASDFLTLDEPLMKLIVYLTRSIWDEGIFVILVLSFLTLVLVFYGISHYDDNEITLILLLYIFSGAMGFAFNGIRQALAASFVFAFSQKSKKHWLLKYIIIVFIAFLIHKSALVMLPLLLLAQMKVSGKRVLLLFASAAVLPFCFDFILDLMHVNTTSPEALAYIEQTINPLRIVVSFAPLLLILVMQDRKKFLLENAFITNLSILNAVLMLSTYNSAYLNRVTQYTGLFLILFIPRALQFVEKKLRFLLTVLALVCYAVFWKVEMGEAMFQWSFSHFGAY